MKSIRQIIIFFSLTLFSILVILVMSSQGWAATYYLDASNGNDNKDGLSPSTAWETIAKVNSSNFQPGDYILFKRGEIWREQLAVPFSGSEGSPITFGAFGIGDKPIINGANLMTNWVNAGGNIWEKTAVTTVPKVVVFDSIWGEYESGGVASLDTNYEWYWDSGTYILYVYTDGGDPDTQWPTGICVGQRLRGILVDFVDYINITGIAAKHANWSGIDLLGANNCIVDSVYVSWCGASSFSLYNANNNIIQNSLSTGGAGGFGLVEGSSNNIIQNCEVDGGGTTAQQPGLGGILVANSSNLNIIRYNLFHSFKLTAANTREGDGIAVTTGSNHNEFYYNIIYKTNDAIHLHGNGTDSNKIYNNVVYDIVWELIGIESGADSNIIKNNIFADPNANVTMKLFADGGDHNIVSNNSFGVEGASNFVIWKGIPYSTYDDWEAAYGTSTNSVEDDPKLTDPDNNDFTLQSTSPTIDAGIDVGLTQDYTGTSVPAGDTVDIGAYEYKGIEPPKTLRFEPLPQ